MAANPKYFLLLFVFAILYVSCRDVQESPLTQPSPRVLQSNNNSQLTGAWVVKELNIPTCKLCDDNNQVLNQLWRRPVSINDTFIFRNDTMRFEPSPNALKEKYATEQAGLPIIERYRFNDSSLALVGSDWIYSVYVMKFVSDTLVLTVPQSYSSEMDSNEGPKDLVVVLNRRR